MCDVNQTDGAKSLCSGAVPPSTRHVHIPSGKYWPGDVPAAHMCCTPPLSAAPRAPLRAGTFVAAVCTSSTSALLSPVIPKEPG
jgi:hypothetical protein